MLTLYQLKVDDLERELAFRIAGGPNPDRVKIAAILFHPRHYEPVARMRLPGTSWGLQTIYTATQNTDQLLSWSRSPPVGVEPIEPVAFLERGQLWGRRSSMVGDVIEHSDDDGKVATRWVVDWQGFKELPR